MADNSALALSLLALGKASQGGGGTTYTAGEGIAINSDNEISALVDGETILFNEDGELTAVSGSAEIPTITPTLSQVISIDPLTVQFTTEQSAIIEDENVVDILFILSNLGKNDCYFKKNATSASDNLIILHCWYGGDSKKDVRISYYTDNKRGVYSEVNCGGIEYTAGDGITIENNEISVDDDYIKQIPVNGAYQLISNDGQIVEGEFISRTTAGDASITTGNASRIYLRGNSENNTKVDASVELLNAENATVDTATYIAYAESQGDATGTKVFTEDDANYGISLNGDESVTASYIAKSDGTIINATPTGMISTGFNQYNHTTGKAYIIEGNRYQVFGTYTSVGSEVIEDNVQVNSYTIPHSFVASMTGEVTVTGGNATDTMIALVWSGYNYNHEYVAYNTDTVAITDVTGWGMPRVNGVYDEIDFENQQYIKRIGRDVVANKDLYNNKIYDSTYVYYVIGEDIKSSISISNTYLADDFGQEIFTGTNVPVGLVVLYGNNLKDKLRTDVLTISAQTLTEVQFNQVMSNLQLGAEKHSAYKELFDETDYKSTSGQYSYYNCNAATVNADIKYDVTWTYDGVDYSKSNLEFTNKSVTSGITIDTGGIIKIYFQSKTATQISVYLSTSGTGDKLTAINVTSHDLFTTYTPIDSNLIDTSFDSIALSDNGLSKANGHSIAIDGSSSSTITYVSASNGSIAFGTTGGGGSNAAIDAQANGLAFGQGYSGPTIQTIGVGGMAFGYTQPNGHISNNAIGGIAGGRAEGNSWVQTRNNANFALGYASASGRVVAEGTGGTIAVGYANTNRIIAGENTTKHGMVAMGYVDNTTGDLSSIGDGAIALGYGVQSNADGQIAVGKCNVKDTNNQYVMIVGNGTSDSARSNALTVDWDGNLVCNNIPAPPSADGEYDLHCSIVDGAITYSWVARE